MKKRKRETDASQGFEIYFLATSVSFRSTGIIYSDIATNHNAKLNP